MSTRSAAEGAVLHAACQTPRGKAYLREQDAVMNRAASCFGMTATGDRHDRWPAPAIDAQLNLDGHWEAAAEIKTRPSTTLDELMDFHTAIVTNDKIPRGTALAAGLFVPYLVLYGLTREKIVLAWKMTNAKGDPLIKEGRDYEVEWKNVTQPLLGVKEWTWCAMLPLDLAHVLTPGEGPDWILENEEAPAEPEYRQIVPHRG